MRAKMYLEAVIGNSWGKGVKAFFRCQYDPSIEEDKSFSKATPTGQAEFVIDNPTVFNELVIGKAYYVDFVQVP